MQETERVNSINILVVFICVLISCAKPSPQPTTPQPTTPGSNSQQSQVTSLLTSGEWKLKSETVDGVDKTALYTGFTIRFTSSTFTTVKGVPLWPASGTWTFQGTDATAIVRNDGVIVQVQATGTELVMKFTWQTTTLGPGRAASIQGQQVFTMNK